MKLSKLQKLKLQPGTLGEIDIDITDVIVADEFGRKVRWTPDDPRDYRQRAVDRLIEIRVPFATESNIASTMATRVLKVVCPYCFKEMILQGSTGDSSTASMHYMCNCRAKISITLPNGSGIVIAPK